MGDAAGSSEYILSDGLCKAELCPWRAYPHKRSVADEEVTHDFARVTELSPSTPPPSAFGSRCVTR